MKIELTSVKYAAFASRETSCFEAIIVIDGVKSIHVSNDGHGGCDCHHDIIPGALRRLTKYASGLPMEGAQYGKFRPTTETIVGDLLDEHLSLKDMRKALKKCVHYAIDGKIFKHPNMKMESSTRDVIVDSFAKRQPKAVILNTLPEDEAIKIWMNNR